MPSDAEQKRKRATGWKSVAWRVMRLFLLIYLGLLLVLSFIQNALIFPGKSSKGTPYATIKSPPIGAELIKLTTAAGDEISALYGGALTKDSKPHPDAAKLPTVIFCYGNAMCLANSLDLFGDFRRAGCNVIIPEYVGYGMSSGSVSERGCYEAADAAYDYLQSRNDIDKSKIIASGWSLGGAVAIDLASRKKFAGLAVFSTFTSIAEMGHAIYPFLPTFTLSMIIRSPFLSESKIKNVSCPILIGHSRGDRMIPFEMSERLAAAAPGKPQRIIIDKPDHNAFFDGDRAKVWQGITEFIEQIAR